MVAVNAFERLGIDSRLAVSDEELAEAFRAAGKLAHPDAGGGEGDFAALHEARAVLASPSRRLRHWMELRGVSLETRGSIDDRLMELFGVAGAATQRAEAVARKRDDARSALARALLETETQLARETVEDALAQVDAALAAERRVFPEFEASPPEPETAAKVARNLAFLEKWRAGLRSAYARLA